MTLPPGVSAEKFAAALSEFAGAVGKEWVFSSPEDVALYRDAYSIYWDEPEERVASAAVAPASVEQVQAVVRIANKYKIPLYAISTGRNLTYGGSAPNLSGSVVLDLKRMNRVIEVDEKRHFAIVEPGVSYFDLYRHIQERGLKVWIDCPDPGWGSLMGNALDHGIGYTSFAYRDHFGAHCGMEVVLANGEVMRTGMGALPGAPTWAEYRYGFGPYVDGLFAQGNCGIVTKMGFRLMPEPEAYLSGVVFVPRYEDLIPLVEDINYLEDSSLCAMPIYGSPLGGGRPAGSIIPDELQALIADGWPSNEKLNRYAAEKKQPCWQCTVQFYGPEATVRANWQYAQQRIGKHIPGATFRENKLYTLPLSATDQEQVRKVTFGIPNMEVFQMVTRNQFNAGDPPDGHADFTTVLPRNGEAVQTSARVYSEVYRKLGVKPSISPFSAPVTWQPYAFIQGVVVPTYRDPVRNKAMRELFNALIDVATEHGWAEYRTAPAFQDKLAKQFSFGDHALMRFNEAIKDAVDPNGILSPGRCGVWPKRFRGNHNRGSNT